jgi:hypothetical protein
MRISFVDSINMYLYLTGTLICADTKLHEL